MNSPKVSIICVTFNSAEFLSEFFQSVEKLPKGWAEALFIDNASKDKTIELIGNWGRADHLITNLQNLGWSAANNQGIAASNGEMVLFANPDIHFEPAALQELVRFLDERQEFAAVAPQLINPDGSIQPSCRQLPAILDLFFQIVGLGRLFPKTIFNRWKMPDFDHQSFKEVEQPMTSALLIRREAFEKAGKLDERFFVFFGDVDLAHRLKKAGFRLAFWPEAKVFHHRGGSTEKMRAAFYFSSHFGFFRYLWKWSNLLEKAGLLLLWPLVLVSASGRAFIYFFSRR